MGIAQITQFAKSDSETVSLKGTSSSTLEESIIVSPEFPRYLIEKESADARGAEKIRLIKMHDKIRDETTSFFIINRGANH